MEPSTQRTLDLLGKSKSDVSRRRVRVSSTSFRNFSVKARKCDMTWLCSCAAPTLPQQAKERFCNGQHKECRIYSVKANPTFRDLVCKCRVVVLKLQCRIYLAQENQHCCTAACCTACQRASLQPSTQRTSDFLGKSKSDARVLEQSAIGITW